MAKHPKNGQEESFNEYEEAFKLHRQNAEKIKTEYDELYERLPEKLSSTHLEPFAKILLEQEGIVLDIETCINSLKHIIREQLFDPWDRAWEEHVANNIAKLEILKDHFKDFEGQDWEMESKSVEDRTRPLRMEYKVKRLHCMQKLLKHQQQHIQKVKEETLRRRAIVNHVAEEMQMLNKHLDNLNSENKGKQLTEHFNEILFKDCTSNNEKDEANMEEQYICLELKYNTNF